MRIEAGAPTLRTPLRRLTVRARRVPGMPMLSVKVLLRGGTRAEALPGQALITGRLLTEGTRQRDWRQIVDQAEDLGIALSSSGTYEAIHLSLDALAEDWEKALLWLAELTFDSTFPDERFEWVRRQAAAELDGLLDQPDLRTALAFLRQVYGPHPYGRALHGSRQDLERLTLDDCLAFHRQSLAWGVLVVIAGDIDEAEVCRRAEDLFGRLTGEAEPVPEPPPPLPGERCRELTAGEADQAHLYAGHLTLPRRHPQAAALELIGVVLGAGAGLSGRLPERIREHEGLAYTAQVAIRSGSGFDPGRLVIYAGTSPATVGRAERAIREELQRLIDHGIGHEELEEARSYLIGREPLARQTARQWVEVLAESEFYDLPSDRLEWVVEQLQAVSEEDVERTVRQLIRPDDLRVTVGRPR